MRKVQITIRNFIGPQCSSVRRMPPEIANIDFPRSRATQHTILSPGILNSMVHQQKMARTHHRIQSLNTPCLPLLRLFFRKVNGQPFSPCIPVAVHRNRYILAALATKPFRVLTSHACIIVHMQAVSLSNAPMLGAECISLRKDCKMQRSSI